MKEVLKIKLMEEVKVYIDMMKLGFITFYTLRGPTIISSGPFLTKKNF